ncbi:MAG: LysR family transcriptional regulator [Burkholderiales bacterium]|jgi:DNA-binding transcriptional LysR family regulator|nr:LysR family transcriptional regulator [Burkholderiales bacterium]
MDRIDGFRLFVRVVETGSFSRAARDLAVTQPTVTRHVAALEARIGVRLLNRNTRRVGLTDAGRAYYERVKAVLDLVEETEHVAADRQRQLAGRVRIATSIAFGRRVVTPLILSFMRAHPAIEIDLRCDDSYVDLVALGVDVSVRLGRLQDSSLGARLLGHNPWALVASPTWVQRHGAPDQPADLARHAVLLYSTVQADDQLHFRHPRHGPTAVRVRGPLRSNNLSTLLAAVVEGHGVAALPLYVAGVALATGRVQPLLPDWSLPGQDIHAVFPSPRGVPGKVEAFVAHLKAHFARPDWHAVDGEPRPARRRATVRG